MSEESARDTSLDKALAGLEPAKASPDFTRRVVAALESRELRPQRAFGAWVFAAAAAATVAIGIFLGARSSPPATEIAAERESLRREYSELKRELESLRVMARDTAPVLYLGTEQDTDLVLDLSPLLEASTNGVRPAALDRSEQPIYY